MSRFNPYLNSHFQGLGCRLIARAFDKCRERRVTIHAIPGYWDCVGVSDGTDAWIAPASAGLFMKTSTGDCADLMRRLQAGDELPPVPDWPDVAADEIKPRPRSVRLPLEAADEEIQPRRKSRVAFV